jgi:hypothetical protein
MKRYISSRVPDYDGWTTYAFTVAELEDCARESGISFRRGDILLIRGGFTERWELFRPRRYLFLLVLIIRCTSATTRLLKKRETI